MLYQQPIGGPLRLDPSNPLTRGLVFVQAGADSGPFSNFNGVGVIATKLGPAKKFTSASSQYLSAPNNVIDPASLTFIVFGSVNSASTSNALISIGAATNDRVLLYTTTSGEIALFSGSAAGGNSQAISGLSAVVAGQQNAFGGRVFAANNRDVWLNGANVGSAATSSPVAACGTIAVGAYYTSGAPTAGFYLDGTENLSMAWNRPISDADMRSVMANPWQLFLDQDEDDEAIMFAVSNGGVNATVTATLDTATSSAAATASVQGAATVTLGAATLSATGTAPSANVNAALTATLAGATATGTATVAVSAAATVTLGAVTLSASGGVQATIATLSQTLGGMTASAAATAAVAAVVSQALNAATLAATGTAPLAGINGVMTVTLGSVQLSSFVQTVATQYVQRVYYPDAQDRQYVLTDQDRHYVATAQDRTFNIGTP